MIKTEKNFTSTKQQLSESEWFKENYEIWLKRRIKHVKIKMCGIYREKTINPLWIWAQFYQQTPNSSLNKNKKEITVLCISFLYFIQSSLIRIKYRFCNFIVVVGLYIFYIRLSICFHFVPFESAPWLWKWWLWLAWRSEENKKKIVWRKKRENWERDTESRKKFHNTIQYEISTRLGRTLAKSCN